MSTLWCNGHSVSAYSDHLSTWSSGRIFSAGPLYRFSSSPTFCTRSPQPYLFPSLPFSGKWKNMNPVQSLKNLPPGFLFPRCTS